ncbi:hypothetical protein O3M35_013362 [Rhynocoris fuscipes]|uniref:Protein SMG9 n=1 Tax=Rhynocoris fuscipes TaxID=488301 RepID=A0AAW1CJA9_9HEMI
MDQDRGRDFRRKKFPLMRDKEEKPMKRPIILMKSKDAEKSSSNKVDDAPIPTILLKTRDGDSRAVSPQTSLSSKSNKDSDSGPTYQLVPRVPAPDLSILLSAPPSMKTCVKLLDDEAQVIQDGLLEYLTESTDFLVVGCIGFQSSGKSTIMSHFANPHLNQFNTEDLIFKAESKTHIDSSSHCTEGIDAYITDERVILLDSQPILSLSVLSKHYNCEGNLSARSCSRDDPDYPCLESDIELLSLQYAAFLLTVCHVVILVTDYSTNDELIKFLLSVEILKPSTGVHSDEDTLMEYFPHTIIVQNKMDNNHFDKRTLQILQDNYKKQFANSQLPIQSGIGIANGNILKSLSPELCKTDPINLFLLPKFQFGRPLYQNPHFSTLIRDLRVQIFGLAPGPLTHTLLTEKNWWHYAVKIWEDIKKSTLFPEYGRLLPTPSSAKVELNQT